MPSSSVMAYWLRIVAMIRSVSDVIEATVLRSRRPPLLAVMSDKTRCSAAPVGASLPPRSSAQSDAPLCRIAADILVGDMTSVCASSCPRVTTRITRRACFSNCSISPLCNHGAPQHPAPSAS